MAKKLLEKMFDFDNWEQLRTAIEMVTVEMRGEEKHLKYVLKDIIINTLMKSLKNLLVFKLK